MKRLFPALAALFLLTAAAHAQTTAAGSVRGYVRDITGAVLPGVTVTATSPTVPGVFLATSDGEGYYRLLELPPGAYSLTFELDGFTRLAREGVVVRAGTNIPVDVSMGVGALADTVEVKAETPMLESRDVVQAVNISGEFQRSVPLSARRDWADFMAVTPGVVTVQFPGASGLYYIRGADFSSHVLQIDGADVGSAAQGATGFINLSSEALGDTQIKTGAIDASSPIGLGAVVNLATPSGTNAVRGAAGLLYQAKGWNWNNVPGGTASEVNNVQPDLAVGGPLMRDKWWGFAAYRYTRSDTGVSRTAQQVATLEALSPGFEPFDSRNEANYIFLKTNAQLTPRHRAQFFYQKDDNPSDLVNPIDADRFLNRGPEGVGVSAQLSSIWSDALTSRFTLAFNDKANQGRLYDYGPTPRVVHSQVFPSSGVLLGSGPIAYLDNSGSGFDSPYQKWTVSADFSYYKTGWKGSHEIQFGLYGQPLIRVQSDIKLPAGGFILQEEVLRNAANPGGGTIPFHRQIASVADYTDQTVDSSDYAVYVQDAWRPIARLAVTAGVRVDFITRTDKIFDVRVQETTAAGPRLGVNYMISADQRDALRASWSGIHEVLAQNIVTAGTALAGIRDEYDTDLNGTFETVFVTPPSTAVSSDRRLDENRKQPRVDEVSVGYRRQFPGQVAVDVSWVRREYRDRTAYVDENSIIENGVFKGYRDPTQNQIYYVTENTWNWPVYNGLELQVARQGTTWQLIGSLTRQWRHVAGTWQPNDPALFIQPEAFDNDKGIGATRGSQGDANSLSGRSMAGAQVWRDNIFSVAGSYQLPWGFTVATNYSFQSGLWSGPVVTRIGAPDPAFGPPVVTLPNGRVVANPLATVIRFAGDTRSDEQFRTPDLHVWNLRLGHRLKIGNGSLETAVDFYNLPNNGAAQYLFPGGNQTYNPFYQQGFLVQLPRAAQVSARFTF